VLPDGDTLANMTGSGRNSSQLWSDSRNMPASLPSWSRFRRSIASLARTYCEHCLLGTPFFILTAPRREVVQVPENSEDAKKWPLWSESGPSNQNTADVDNQVSNSSAALAPVSSANENSKPKARGPRKSKLVLPSLPTSSRNKVKKLTTLDKSSMDWKAHVDSDGVKDELDANRRSGGYLGKVEFLQRVSERKDDVLEENRAKKRRR